MSDTGTAIIGILLVLAVGAGLGSCVSNRVTTSERDAYWKASAVKHRAGEFWIPDSLTGKTIFRWKEMP
jgi:hypothetical protein